jgi:hypothetical protein
MEVKSMATIKILNAKGKYNDDFARQNVIAYILQPNKTPHRIIGGIRIDMANPAQSMTDVAVQFNKDSKVRLRHFVLSFNPNEVAGLDMLQTIAQWLCKYIGMYYQVVYALHEDTDHPHIHFVFNSICYHSGQRYRGDKAEYYDLLNYTKNALHHVGIHCLIEVKYRPEVTGANE